MIINIRVIHHDAFILKGCMFLTEMTEQEGKESRTVAIGRSVVPVLESSRWNMARFGCIPLQPLQLCFE